MFYYTLTNTLAQLSAVDITTPLVFLAFLALGISLGVLIAFMYFLHVFRRDLLKPPQTESLSTTREKINTIESAQQSLSASIEELRNSLKMIQDNTLRLEAKITSLEGRMLTLERRRPAEAVRTGVYPKPTRETLKEVAALKDIGEIALYFPEVRYAGIITSQGYIVKQYGQCSEEPPKLLEILRLSNMDKTSLIKGNRRIDLFRLGEVKDLTVFGIIEVDNLLEVDENRIGEIRETISKYYRDVIAKTM
ncbi:MAG: hypothetical protein ACP5II_00205 [Infirmifilum sp.]|uniref:hypothetical protein n=1 Tax=Infirmifilum sp. TaxID=2856575 RepID=UPI003CBD94A2